jgi:C1A family cysteine protease
MASVSVHKNEQKEYANITKPHPNLSKLMKGVSRAGVPSMIDLRSKFPSCFDQGQLGSCTANALCGVISYDIPKFMGSRLFLYYNERLIEHDIEYDNGAFLSDGIQSLKIFGICSETSWPYDISKFTLNPDMKCYREAKLHCALNVKPLTNSAEDMKNALRNGYPFVVGILVYESFTTSYVARTGIVRMPLPNESLLGGHAIVCVGYNDQQQVWIMRNSWGTQWGDKGYFYLPYQYLINHNLAQDMWCITKMQI